MNINVDIDRIVVDAGDLMTTNAEEIRSTVTAQLKATLISQQLNTHHEQSHRHSILQPAASSDCLASSVANSVLTVIGT